MRPLSKAAPSEEPQLLDAARNGDEDAFRRLGEPLRGERVRELPETFMDALQRRDVDVVVPMLAEDAAWSMPPPASWYRGGDPADSLRIGPLSGQWRWRHRATRANGQPASAAYTWDEEEGCGLPFALDVMTLEGGRIKQITAFIVRTVDVPDRDAFGRWPEQELDRAKVSAVFESFGLPARLD